MYFTEQEARELVGRTFTLRTGYKGAECGSEAKIVSVDGRGRRSKIVVEIWYSAFGYGLTRHRHPITKARYQQLAAGSP